MKNTNGNLPAMPQTHSDNLCQQTGTAKAEHAGLTKREMFAMAAMQGILSCGNYTYVHAASDAVKYADALLAELERQA
jgi:hypothetical protein